MIEEKMKPLRIHILRNVYNLWEVNFRMLLEDMEDVGEEGWKILISKNLANS